MLDISEFDKDQLAEYAFNTFTVELDMRKGLAKLKDEVKALQEKPKPEVVKPPDNPKATHILNRDNGRWFEWTALLAQHLKNAVPCDKDGNPV